MLWVPNESYNGPHKPGIQRVVNYIGASGPFNMWLNKELDVMSNIPLADLRFMRRDPELNKMLTWFNNFQVDYLSLDTMNPPLDNLKLRQALSHAIDRNELNDVVYISQGAPHQAAPRPESVYYHERLATQHTEFDLDKANEYLDKVLPDKDAEGFRLNKNGERFSFILTARTDIVNGDDRIVVAHRPAAVDHFLAAPFHLGVATLHGGKIEILC